MNDLSYKADFEIHMNPYGNTVKRYSHKTELQIELKFFLFVFTLTMSHFLASRGISSHGLGLPRGLSGLESG